MKNICVRINREFFIKEIEGDYYEFESGKVYFLQCSKYNIQEIIFEDYKSQISFINSPFKSAIKVIPYFEKHKKNLLLIKGQINSLNIVPFKIDEEPVLDLLLLIIAEQLAIKDFIVVEPAGLNEESMSKLHTFCSIFMDLFPNKLLIIINFLYVTSEKLWVDILDKTKTLNDILYSIPPKLRNMKQYPFSKKA